MATVSIRQALQAFADNGGSGLDPIDTPVYEMVAGALFDIANSPSAQVRGSMARATRAQRLILNRLVGTRRPGTHPAQRRGTELDFLDLAAGVSDGK